jgi:hypothetical protein
LGLLGNRGGAVSCALRNSFVAATLVMTPLGAVPIGAIQVGDLVTAYDESTGTTGAYPVSLVHRNDDPVTGSVVIAGETIETTPEHPFNTLEAGWTDAQDLRPGMHVPSAAGDPGVVEAVSFTAGPGIMYNLTVEVAHTFFVGEGAWLVHNCGPNLPGTGIYDKAAGGVGGHHPHAQAAFDTPPYNGKRAFAVGDKQLDRASGMPGTHGAITRAQQRHFADLRRSGRPNTMREHTRIAVQSMVDARVPLHMARSYAARSLWSLRAQGIRAPSRIPWERR